MKTALQYFLPIREEKIIKSFIVDYFNNLFWKKRILKISHYSLEYRKQTLWKTQAEIVALVAPLLSNSMKYEENNLKI